MELLEILIFFKLYKLRIGKLGSLLFDTFSYINAGSLEMSVRSLSLVIENLGIYIDYLR